MDSSTRATLAVGVAAGYVVGRTKHEKLALSLLSLVTGRALDPVALIGQGIRKLAETPQFEQFGESLTGVLEQRTRSLLDSEPDEEETEAPQPSQRRPAGQAKAEKPSARAAGPKNPPAAKAKAMGRKAKAERSARRPGPRKPPAA